MNFRYSLLSTLMILSCMQLSGQSDYQQIVPASNDVTTASGLQVYWSLGDVYTDDLLGSTHVISQLEHELASQYGLQLIGNPTEAITRLELSTPIPITYQVYNLQGRVLITHKAGAASQHDIDLSALPSQIYLISVFATEGKRLLATYRVQKN